MGFAAGILPRLPGSSGTSRPLRAAALLAAVTALLLPVAGVAAAAPPGPAAGPVPAAGPAAEARTAAPRAATPGGPHCTLAAGTDQQPRCFATFPAAVAFATGGRVRNAPAAAADAARDPRFDAAVEAAGLAASPDSTTTSVIVGIEWADANWRGATVTFYASGRCDDSSDADYRFPSMPSGWNDRISSFKSYSNCAQQLFKGTSFSGGALTIVVASLSYVGAAANDQASSVTFN